jgi:hypothetical protein
VTTDPRQRAEALRQTLFAADGTMAFTTAGTSMMPTIRPGQSVILNRWDGAPLVRGRCYAFLEGARLLLHRHVATRGEYASFIGDNMLAPHAVRVYNILGELRVRSFLRQERIVRSLTEVTLGQWRIRRWLIARIAGIRRSGHEKEV